MKQRFFLIGALLIFTMMCSGFVADARVVQTKKTTKTQAVKKGATRKVAAKKKVKTKSLSTPISSSAPREETFAQFLSRQTKKKQTCIRTALGSKKITTLLRDSGAALGGADVKKVSRCVHYFIEY